MAKKCGKKAKAAQFCGERSRKWLSESRRGKKFYKPIKQQTHSVRVRNGIRPVHEPWDLAEMQTQPGVEDIIGHLHPNHLLSVRRKNMAKKPKQPNPTVDGAESDRASIGEDRSFRNQPSSRPTGRPTWVAKAVFSSNAKKNCDRILLIWSTKWSLFTNFFTQMGCKSRDESNDAN